MLTREDAMREVTENILPFWQGMADQETGGFYGEADFYGTPDKTANKGGVLNSRLLWTFSAAYRALGDRAYKPYADRARDFLAGAFWDAEYGGVYWLTDRAGRALNDKKQFYNIAFAVYALSEHYMAFGEESSLEKATALFDVLEARGLDPAYGGYIEARTREWGDIGDFRLSDKELNCPKSMNTNLHVLEAYTSLARAGGDKRVRDALGALIRVTMDQIISRDRRFGLFFNMDWNSLSGEISYGHDIEGSWLLYEAALAVGGQSLIAEARRTALEIAEVVYAEAIDRENGGLFSGRDEEGALAPNKEWWPQAEAVVGFYNAFELSGERKYLDATGGIWDFLQTHFTDSEHGEWHYELHPSHAPNPQMPKAGFWKCPYHNARACFEIMRRMK